MLTKLMATFFLIIPYIYRKYLSINAVIFINNTQEAFHFIFEKSRERLAATDGVRWGRIRNSRRSLQPLCFTLV